MDGDGASSGAAATGATGSARSNWWIYRGDGLVTDPTERDHRWPAPPRWRSFSGGPDLPPPPPDEADIDRRLGAAVPQWADPDEINMVNAALYLRRPLLVTGSPGTGKSSLALRISRELGLGRVLRWPITSRSTLRSAQYEYDSIGHAQTAGRHGDEAADIGNYIHLGPLGTAFLPHRLPRVLLIDEVDKSDVDLPNDLLNMFEDGVFPIPELIRVRDRQTTVMVHTADPGRTAPVCNGFVQCHEFPVVIMTSNGERDFPAPFLRRCLRLEIAPPDERKLAAMIAAHFPTGADEASEQLIAEFLNRRGTTGRLAADQLLNAVHLVTSGQFDMDDRESWATLLKAIWRPLSPVS